MDDDVSSSSDEEEQTERPYNELLQLLQTDADSKGPARKRRKVDNDTSDTKVAAAEEAEEDAEADALQDQAPSDDEEEAQDDEDDDAAGPFEKHFNLPDGSDLSKKIEQIQANKWVSAKKEADGLRFVQSIPDMGDAASLLPAIKSTANLKVCRDLYQQFFWPTTNAFSSKINSNPASPNSCRQSAAPPSTSPHTSSITRIYSLARERPAMRIACASLRPFTQSTISSRLATKS